jgi:tetratricopeptide (TPR) repeat protein
VSSQFLFLQRQAISVSAFAAGQKSAELFGIPPLRRANPVLGDTEKWYEQAVKLDSQSFLAHYYYAAIAMQAGTSADRAAQIEASLRAATKLNPSFALAFDRLVVLYGTQHKNLDEARMLSVMAVQLDPSNVGFRLNGANLLMQMGRTKDAIAVLQHAMKLGADPKQIALIQSQVESIQQYQAAREQAERDYRHSSEQGSSGDQSSPQGQPELPTPTPEAGNHPEDGRHVPRRMLKGTLRHVKCSSPATMTLNVESAAKQVDLRTRNYYQGSILRTGRRQRFCLPPQIS